MHEGKVLIFILSIDMQDTGFNLDDISGKAAQAMGPDSRSLVWRHYPVTDQSKSLGLYQIRGKKETAGPQRWQIGKAAHRKKLERSSNSAYDPNSDNKAGRNGGNYKGFQGNGIYGC
jgi:hypothetical protein